MARYIKHVAWCGMDTKGKLNCDKIKYKELAKDAQQGRFSISNSIYV